MRIPSRQFCLLYLAIVLLLNGENLMAATKLHSERSARKFEQDKAARLAKDKAREIKKLSSVALERASAGCAKVIDSKTKKPMLFVDGQPVITDDKPAIGLSKRLVCNDNGDTAYVNEQGVIEPGSIAPTAPEDMDKFRKLVKGKSNAGNSTQK